MLVGQQAITTAAAAEPFPSAAAVPWADPQALLDRLFGPPTDQENRQLAQIEVSPREERKIGSEVAASYVNQLKQRGVRVVSRGPVVDYLRDLVETIRPQMRDGRRYARITVLLATSSECEARSFPGGTLLFYQGLLDCCDNEAALIGIVGHELSHLDRGHHLGRIRRVKLARQTFSGQRQVASPAQFFGSAATLLRIWTRPFQAELETEADLDGASWAYQAGYDPREMAKLFADLQQRGKRAPLPSFLQSHPAPLDRSQTITALYEKLQRTHPHNDLYIGTENLRRRVARSRHPFPE